MIRKLHINESNKFNRNRCKVESANDIVNNLVSLTKGMWFEPMSKFKSIVYNADEIIPKIDFNSCVEFGTNNGQELIIYDKQDGRKHIRYSCSMTTMFDELVITDVWDKSGCVYECDWDAIFDELAEKNNYNINEALDGGNIRALAYSTADEIVKVLGRYYTSPITDSDYQKLKDLLDNMESHIKISISIDNRFELIIDTYYIEDIKIKFKGSFAVYSQHHTNPTSAEIGYLCVLTDKITDIISDYNYYKKRIITL